MSTNLGVEVQFSLLLEAVFDIVHHCVSKGEVSVKSQIVC